MLHVALLSVLPQSGILLNVMAAISFAITPLSITDCHGIVSDYILLNVIGLSVIRLNVLVITTFAIMDCHDHHIFAVSDYTLFCLMSFD